jgi:hypothetical protein
LPDSRITSSHTLRGQGSTPAPASAPNITAETTVPVFTVTASMSNSTAWRASARAASARRCGSCRPSAMCIFSTVV